MCVQLGLLERRPAGLLPRRLKMMGLHIYGSIYIYIHMICYKYIQNMEEVYTSRALIAFFQAPCQLSSAPGAPPSQHRHSLPSLNVFVFTRSELLLLHVGPPAPEESAKTQFSTGSDVLTEVPVPVYILRQCLGLHRRVPLGLPSFTD